MISRCGSFAYYNLTLKTIQGYIPAQRTIISIRSVIIDVLL